ncbi:MAG: hypothetical protein ACK4MQ_07635 [Hyphomonas sp.]
MIHYLDCEFNGFCGDLISLALTGEAGELYLARPEDELSELDLHPWVAQHVRPVISAEGAVPERCPLDLFGPSIQKFLKDDPSPVIIADWPEDIAHFMRCLITGPGMMVSLPEIQTRLVPAVRGIAYPDGGVMHNALWDARMLRLGMEL